MSEDTIYADKNVSVTTARVIILGTTYALRNITSVKMTVTPAKRGCAAGLLGIGVFGTFVSFAGYTQDTAGAALVALVIGGVMVAAGILWMLFLKPAYSVTIASSAG